MIREKKMMKSCSVFHTSKRWSLKSLTAFLSVFLRSSFGRIKVMWTVVKREYTRDITRHICFAYQLNPSIWYEALLNGISYSFILENHFYFINAPDYCFWPSLFRIFYVKNFVKLASSIRKFSDPYISHIIALHILLFAEINRFRC